MLSDHASSLLRRSLATLPSSVWRLVLSDQADHVVGVAVIDPLDETTEARLWNVEGREIAQVTRNTPIRELVEMLLRAQCIYVR